MRRAYAERLSFSSSLILTPNVRRRQNIRLEGQSEENFCLELNNGCICCTVRADMAKAVAQMLEIHRSGKKLDAIIIETTGMANPAPVVQTFFADKALSSGVFLDGVITVVDAKHIKNHLHEKEGVEAVKQLSYADRIILNKTDLVSKDELRNVNEMIYKINSSASIFETIRANVDIKYLLDIRAFEVDRILKTVDPEFLEVAEKHDHDHEEHKCSDDECSHHHHHHHHHHKHDDHECDESCDHDSEKKSHDHHKHDHKHDHHKHDDHKHDHHKHDHKHDDHKHDDHKHDHHKHDHRHKSRHSSKVSSVGIAEKGDVDYDILLEWLNNLLLKHGPNMYRMKGVLNIQDDDHLFVFQGVHQTWDLQPMGTWKDGDRKDRVNKLIFIGEKLDRKELNENLRRCLVGTPEHAEAREDLEKVWQAQAFWNQQLGMDDDESRNLNTYDVELHNGTHGLGLMLSECKVDGKNYVVVAGFAKLPEGVTNNAKESSVILKADALTHVNGTDVSDMDFNDIITILRQLPRGSGIAGAMVKLKFRILEEEIVRKVYAYFEKSRKAKKKAKRSNEMISSGEEKKNIADATDGSAEKRRKLWKS